MGKHTKGPWKAKIEYEEGFLELVEVWSEGGQVCAFMSDDWGTNYVANARLIAASPIMYDYIAKRALLGDNEAKSILQEIDDASSEKAKVGTHRYMGEA